MRVEGLYSVCAAFIKASPMMRSLLILFLLLNTIFALMGMQLFDVQPSTGYSSEACSRIGADPTLEELPRTLATSSPPPSPPSSS